MVPVIDLLNHQDEPNVYVSYQAARGGFVVEAVRDVKAGDQLTRAYGPGPNAFYFITYGFVPAKNVHNTLMVDLSAEQERLETACREAGKEEEATCEMKQLALLRRAGIFRDPTYMDFERRRDQTATRGWVEAGPKLTAATTVLCMDADQLQSKALVLSALTGQRVSEAVDTAAAQLSMKKLVEARDAMATTLEQDVKQLHMCAYKGVNGSAIPRLRMHIAEKRLLRSCIEATERRVRMSQGPPAPNAAVALPVS